jgi:hypothetical protein
MINSTDFSVGIKKQNCKIDFQIKYMSKLVLVTEPWKKLSA